ncbi:carbon starvation CstA family protein [Halocatena pleomorpha]|uniref:Carbon starvation protein A n=1 Tax=Halocatena pleomorpha TaxID=1785090 RepID=A0A3P3RCG9_9EURY|nr:carbon starvation protein A [Halocatena pleomorpha]RRJ31014.1 carbon starvation protein A [Halocatena pleomorpha]
MVQVLWLIIAVLVLYSVGYLSYSKYLAGFVELDDEQETPAHKHDDGQEYVPAKKSVLLGHHYSSIAGGAPIIGPITAGAAFGWLPAVLWVAIGNPLFGAVHDFMSLSASLRHDGRSIGYIIGEYVGERGKNLLLWFAFLTLILVLAVFAYVVATIFNAYPSAATASMLYIVLALVFGVYLYQLDLPFLPGTVAFVSAVFVSVWIGIQYPIALFATGDLASDVIVLFGDGGTWLPLASSIGENAAAWAPVIIIYAVIAAILPVWMLLQPRDYLSSFLLYTGVGGMVLAAITGTLFGLFDPVTYEGATYSLESQLPAFLGFYSPAVGPIFPFLFVVIACGTVSGFHSLVSSGTTAKQLNKESDARPIGYGAMLGEGLLATTAIAALMIVGATEFDAGLAGAMANFPLGGAVMLSSFGIPLEYGTTFIGLVFVSFLLTSTDTAIRLGRYMMEEIVGTPDTSGENDLTARLEQFAVNRYTNAFLIQGVLAYLLIASGTWSSLWPLFGGANQTLAALALLAATVWLVNWDDSKQLLSTGVPMAIMLVITVLALLWIAFIKNPQTILETGATGLELASLVLQSVLALVLVALAFSVMRRGYNNIQRVRGFDSLTGKKAEEPADD